MSTIRSSSSSANTTRYSPDRSLQSSGEPLSFFVPCGRGFFASSSTFERIRSRWGSGIRSSSFLADRAKRTDQLATLRRSGCFRKALLDEFQGFARLVSTGIGYGAIVEILPQPGMLSKVDDRCLLLPRLVDDKLDSLHGEYYSRSSDRARDQLGTPHLVHADSVDV